MLLVLSFIVGNAFVETYAMCIVDWSEDWATPWVVSLYGE